MKQHRCEVLNGCLEHFCPGSHEMWYRHVSTGKWYNNTVNNTLYVLYGGIRLQPVPAYPVAVQVDGHNSLPILFYRLGGLV